MPVDCPNHSRMDGKRPSTLRGRISVTNPKTTRNRVEKSFSHVSNLQNNFDYTCCSEAAEPVIETETFRPSTRSTTNKRNQHANQVKAHPLKTDVSKQMEAAKQRTWNCWRIDRLLLMLRIQMTLHASREQLILRKPSGESSNELALLAVDRSRCEATTR